MWFRIIPARAGFTSNLWNRGYSTTDHPRSRGVYCILSEVNTHRQGSSPLARGLPPSWPAPDVRRRIIPARAGFTAQPPNAPWRSPDHPRSRGVYGILGTLLSGGDGSSPLARGLRAIDPRIVSIRRIIPARAGFTRRRPGPTGPWSDHPRSRGVYTCESLESQRTRSLPDPRCLHCRPRARSAELR